MAWGRRPRYCCANVGGGCAHALNDTPFDRAQYEAWQGRCQAEVGPAKGCGAALVAGRPVDLRPRWAALSLSAAALGVLAAVVLRVYVMPPPLENIGFAATQTRIDDAAGEVVLEIQRTQDLQAAVRLRAAFVDGSARTGEDYVAPNPVLAMKPGQAQLRLAIPVLADKTFRKSERSFDVVLENVAGRPRHTVVITPVAVTSTARAQLEQAVLNASRIAADIAGFVVKSETMEQLLNDFRDRPAEFKEYRQQLKDAADNLVRAREAYLQAVRTLQAQPPQQVLAAIDHLATDLDKRNFRQQSAVLPVMGRQFQEVLKGQTPDMDRWVHELGQTVPRISPNGRSPRSV